MLNKWHPIRSSWSLTASADVFDHAKLSVEFDLAYLIVRRLTNNGLADFESTMIRTINPFFLGF